MNKLLGSSQLRRAWLAEELSQYSYLIFLKFGIMHQYRMLAQSSSRELLVGVETLLRWVRTSGLKIRGPRSTSTSHRRFHHAPKHHGPRTTTL